jgi:hypothetical protein
MKIKYILPVLLILACCLAATDVLAQCPMCKASLEEARKNGTQVGNSLNSGILYLLALPYSIAAIFGVIFYRKLRRKQQSA